MNPPHPQPSRDDTFWVGIYCGVIAGAFIVAVAWFILGAMRI